MTTLDIRAILEHLPHRYPFLLVDRVLEIEQGKRIVAILREHYASLDAQSPNDSTRRK